ncbi:MAG: type III pantothenate kinase [Anaerolineae bacterium]|nr:type III pantothenate kinase [Anaerolineae bacterium]
MTLSRLLAIKIGNTNIGLGVFESSRLIHNWRVETLPDKTADEYAVQLLTFFEDSGIAPASIRTAAIVSVVPALNDTLCELCARYLGIEPFVAAPGSKSGIHIKYQDPRTLGADRLVSLVAAKQKYGPPLIVIDFGTATTFNVLDAHGDFIGGAISPGMNMAAEALHQFTAKLPRIQVAAPSHALATNTTDALRSGIFFGYVGLVEGMLARLKQEMQEPEPRVIATGGMSKILSPHCPSIDTVDSELGLDGLRILFEMNNP